MLKFTQGVNRQNKYTYLQWTVALILCLCVLLTGHFWPAAEALEDDIMPVIAYNIVDGWRLTDADGENNYGEVSHDYSASSHLTGAVSVANDYAFENASGSAEFEQEMNDYLAQNIQGKYGIRIHLNGWSSEDTRENPWGSNLNIWDFYEIASISFVADRTQQSGNQITAYFEITCNTLGNTFAWLSGGNVQFFISLSGTGPQTEEPGPGTEPAQNYQQIGKWFPADSPQGGADHERADDSRYNTWEGLNLNSGAGSTGAIRWGKQVTDDRDLDAWNIYTSVADTSDFTEVENYLNQKYPYLGVYVSWYFEYPSVQWAYDDSLSGVYEVDGIPEVRTAFKLVTNHTFTAGSVSESDVGISYGQPLTFYLYFVTPPEGIDGVSDWIPGTTANGSAWVEQGKEEKEITEERDSAALEQWDSENPNTNAFAAWLNDEANGYTKLTVNIDEEGWSREPYDVTWKFDHEYADVANDLKYYYFKADTGTTVFYGVNGLFGGKSDRTPLKFYLYFTEEYIKPPESFNFSGWRVEDLNGTISGEITTGTVLLDGTDVHITEYIHLAAETAFQNEPGTDEFAAEMEQYLSDNIVGKYTLWADYNGGWKQVPIKSITFDAERTLRENTNANRNYDPNRIVAMFKVNVVDNFYWNAGTSTPAEFYISVTEAAITRNPVTDEQVIADHVVNSTNYPNTFGGPIIEQPKGVTVNLFDYWLDGTETAPNGTGNLDGAPFYNWTPYNVKWETPRSANVFQSGINIEHLFLFGGGNRFRGWQADKSNPNIVGTWNFYTGDLAAGEDDADGKMNGLGGPNYGIVKNMLGDDGYPVLNLNDASKWGAFSPRVAPWSFFGASDYYDGSSWYVDAFGNATLYKKGPNDASNIGGRSDFGEYFNPTQSSNSSAHFTAVDSSKLTESLGYLFSTDSGAYKKVYEDVRGLFRLDQAGYYYFNAPEDLFDAAVSDGTSKTENTTLTKGRTNVYAYLDPEQKTETDENGNTTDTKYYQMTLYDEAYGTQFFPFDEWGKSFEYDEETGEVKANRFEPDQYDVNETDKLIQIDSYANNLNHFFGMTLDAVFQQPLNGLVNGDDMVFQFSGDDDVWIFVDGILVGDLGGVHSKSSIEINYATGVIRIQDRRWKEWDEFTLYEMFSDADSSLPKLQNIQNGSAAVPKGWEKAENGNLIFSTNTLHELKFFYLERGHEESNLSLSYNFPETNPDRIQKVDEDGNSLSDKATFAIYKAYRKGADGNKDLDLSNELIASNDFSHLYNEFTYEKEVGVEGEPGFQKNDLILKNITDLLELNYAELGEETVLGTIPLAYSTYDTKFFILEETVTPTGYRTNTPIVLQYDSASNTLTVINRYETGAYTSYLAQWTGKVFTSEDTTLPFMAYDVNAPGNKPFVATTGSVNRDDLESGITIVIPIIKQTNSNGNVQWYPMYGSNTYGWHTVNPGGTSNEAFVDALTRAAVMQISADATNTRDWYLKWNDYYQRLEGFMENLPGNATRYLNYNLEGGDMSLIPLYLPQSVLEQIIGKGKLDDTLEDEERFALLKETLQDYLTSKFNKGIDEIRSQEDLDQALEYLTEYIDALKLTGTHILDNSRDSFNRQPRTIFYIPNEQRELRVRKVDQNGNYVNGAVFAIFESLEAAAKFPGDSEYDTAEAAMEALANSLGKGVASYGQTANAQINETLIQPGTLIFRENATDHSYNDGTAPIDWPSSRTAAADPDTLPPVLWLKEIYAPAGYILNENLVRIEVGNTAIYANATGYDSAGNILKPEAGKDSVNDGITVRAALGKLSQTLVKYAMGNNVDVTLQDITIFEQTQTGGVNGALISDGWGRLNDSSFNLHFGINAEELTGQYGRHSSDAALPVFIAEDGYIRVMPRQANGHNESTRRDDLTGINLDNLFGLLNVVVVENEKIEAALEISKEVVGEVPEEDVYLFAISLTAPEDTSADELAGIYNAYIHKTGHQLPILDENGKQVEIDGVPQYSGPCAPADMGADGHTKLYLYVDANGDAWVMTDRNSEPPNADGNLNRLALKDGETYVILGLPEGTGFTITETIQTTSGEDSQTPYDTSIEVKDHLTKDPDYTVTKNERKVTGTLNSADPSDPDADVPSVKVQYSNINLYSNPPEPDDDQAVLLNVGGAGTAIFYVSGGILLIGATLYLLLSKRKRTAL